MTPVMPKSLIESIFSLIQSVLGDSPVAVYIAFAIGCFTVAFAIVRRTRTEIAKSLDEIREFCNPGLAVFTSNLADEPSQLEQHVLSDLPFFKGHVYVEWHGDTMGQDAVRLNRETIELIHKGLRYKALATGMSSFTSTLIMALVEVIVTFMLILLDRPQFGEPNFHPVRQVWLFVILIWPLALLFLQHSFLAGWRELLGETKQRRITFFRQYVFSKVRPVSNREQSP